MPVRRILILLTALLWLTVGRAQAQTRPAATPPEPPPEQLVVRVELPSIVGTVADYASLLFSKEKGKLKGLTNRGKPRTSNPVVVFSVPVPKVLTGKKPAPEPATPPK